MISGVSSHWQASWEDYEFLSGFRRHARARPLTASDRHGRTDQFAAWPLHPSCFIHKPYQRRGVIPAYAHTFHFAGEIMRRLKAQAFEGSRSRPAGHGVAPTLLALALGFQGAAAWANCTTSNGATTCTNANGSHTNKVGSGPSGMNERVTVNQGRASRQTPARRSVWERAGRYESRAVQ